MAKPEKVLFSKNGVFIHTTVARADEDALVAGMVFLLEKPEGIFIEWKALDDLEPQQGGEGEWTVVDTVGYKADKSQDTGTVSMKPKRQNSKCKYVIDFDIKDLKSFKRSKPNLGWSYLIFILQCGTTFPALHFHQGGTKALIKELEKYLIIKRSPSDACLYLVREHDPQALTRSFDELQLFEQQSTDIVTKFMNDPYTATLGGFSKVTNFLRDNLLAQEPMMGRSGEEISVSKLLEDDITGINIDNQEEPGFEMVTTRELPERPEVQRMEPLTPQQWAKYMDKDGCVTNVDELKRAIFRGGVDPSIRIEVWKFLLGYYSWDSTYKSRTEQRKKKVDDYFSMKLQWKSVSEEQERRFSMFKERKSLIDKDVFRTDRTHHYYHGEDNPNIRVLYDILMTYCMYNFDLGYVQGMSDLLSPILVVMENEVDAFWCLAGFMELVCHNFDMDQAGMKKQLLQLNNLVRFVDPTLHNYLESQDSSNMYFCFRWLLIVFKREFTFSDIMRLWEVYWTALPCQNYHLVMCLSILDSAKNVLIENNFGFTEILKHINDMCNTINLDDMLNRAEGIYLQLYHCRDLPSNVNEILGIETTPDLHHAQQNGMSKSSSGTMATPSAASSASTPSTPDKAGKAQVNGRFQSSVSFAGTSAQYRGTSRETTPTPDSAGIEVLPDNMDLVY